MWVLLMNNEEKTPSYGELLAENFRLEHNYEVLENRIKEAIEFIDNNYPLRTSFSKNIYDFKLEIKEILKGGSNE